MASQITHPTLPFPRSQRLFRIDDPQKKLGVIVTDAIAFTGKDFAVTLRVYRTSWKERFHRVRRRKSTSSARGLREDIAEEAIDQ